MNGFDVDKDLPAELGVVKDDILKNMKVQFVLTDRLAHLNSNRAVAKWLDEAAKLVEKEMKK